MEQPTAPDRESASTPDTSEEPPLVPPPATADSLTDAGPSVPQLVRDQRSHSFDADSNGQSATPTPLKKRGIATSMRLLPDSMSGSKEIAVADLAPPSPKPALHSSIIKARGAQGSGLKKRVSISNRPGVIIRATAPEPPPEESGLNASDSSGTPSDPFMTPTSPGPNPFSDAGLPLRSPLSLPPEQSSNSSFDTNDGPEGLSEPPPSPSQLADNKDTVVIRVDTNENDPPDPLTSAVSHSRAEVHVPQDGHLPVIESIQSFEAHGSTINVATDTFEGATAAAIGTAPSPAVAGTESRPAPLMVPAVERATVLKRQYTMGPTVSRPNPLMQNNPVPHHSSAAAISGVAPPAFSQSSPGLPAGDSVQAGAPLSGNSESGGVSTGGLAVPTNLKRANTTKTAKSGWSARRMSLGAALCIPPPPRIDDTMNMKKFVKLALGAIGVVYGDIAVSPIFVLKSIFYADTHALLDGETSFMELERFVNEERVMAILSFIFWVITVVCCFKYIVFVLKADKNGEGGTWALISLLSIENEESPLWKHRDFIFGLGCFAASFLLADSFVAPAICVLSAFEGVKQYSNGGLSVSGVEGLACFVLFVLLMSQRFGTSKVIKFYGPIMLAWFLTIFGVGLYNVSSYPKIFFALSPHHAVQFIVEHTADAYMIISQVVLAVAGVEAMYADLGHFKTIPIRVSFLALVYPALVISYLGQGAYLIQHPSAAAHPFFDSVPTPIKFYVLTLATLAAIIASQATISGCFTLIDQGIALKVFPTIQTIHTSTESAGAVYIPAFNYTLMCGSILLVVIFKESEILADIFGIGVTGTMISTTIFYIIAMKTIWKKPSWQVYLFATFFLLSDLILLAASLRKIISYGWVTTLLGLFFFSVMYIWHTTNFQINTVLQRDHLMEISELRMYVKAIHRTQGTIVFVANMDEDVPNVLGICAQRLRSLPENIVCLSAVASTAPFVADDERYVFRTVDAAAGIYRLVISYGYAERSINTVTAVERARKRGLRVKGDEHVTFVVGRDVVSSARDEKSVLKKMQLAFFARMVANTESLTEFYNLPPSDTLEIASQLII